MLSPDPAVIVLFFNYLSYSLLLLRLRICQFTATGLPVSPQMVVSLCGSCPKLSGMMFRMLTSFVPYGYEAHRKIQRNHCSLRSSFTGLGSSSLREVASPATRYGRCSVGLQHLPHQHQRRPQHVAR